MPQAQHPPTLRVACRRDPPTIDRSKEDLRARRTSACMTAPGGKVDGDTLAALEALAQTQRQIVTLTYNPFFVAEGDPRRWLATLSAEVRGTGATPDEALAALLASLQGPRDR